MAEKPARMKDGIDRVRAADRVALAKRFYTEVGVAEGVSGGFVVLLDGRRIKTPGRVAVSVPSRALAERIAAEWCDQKEFIHPASMPVTRLTNTAIEAGPGRVAQLREELLRYGGNDLLCYRADQPEELVLRQEEVWGQGLGIMENRYAVRFEVISGIVHRPQPGETLARLGQLGGRYGLFCMVALNSLASLTGSAILALGLAEGLFEPDFCWEAAHVDEDFNISRWGEDHEATERRGLRRQEFDAALAMIKDVGPSG